MCDLPPARRDRHRQRPRERPRSDLEWQSMSDRTRRPTRIWPETASTPTSLAQSRGRSRSPRAVCGWLTCLRTTVPGHDSRSPHRGPKSSWATATRRLPGANRGSTGGADTDCCNRCRKRACGTALARCSRSSEAKAPRVVAATLVVTRKHVCAVATVACSGSGGASRSPTGERGHQRPCPRWRSGEHRGLARSTSTIASAGRPARRAAARMASGEEAS